VDVRGRGRRAARGGPPGPAAHDRSRRTPFPNGQSYIEVVELTRSFLADVKRWYDDAVVLVVAHSANRWALDHLLGSGKSMEELIESPFNWQPGWTYGL
ncbi:hypothetical protein AB0E69_00005, partial [Kribbella sp. NPDC026611]